MPENTNLCNHYNPVIDTGLILIADISGFTHYFESANIEHSQKNITSLLEAIIDANELGLTISEIEGDAIFFFKFNDTPSFLDIYDQLIKMSLNFYHALDKLASNKNCKCNACSNLENLKLKFIVHTGKIGTIMIKEYCKLYGIDIIIAHRLLKNNIPINDYVLFTNKIIQKYETEISSIFIGEKSIFKKKNNIWPYWGDNLFIYTS
jgi:uncharacterized protein DUF2652